MNRRKLSVEGLSAVVDAPSNWNGKVAVILAHGAGNGMDSDFIVAFASAVVEAGALAVRFNFPYMEAGRPAPDSAKKLEASYVAVVERVLAEYRPEALVIGGKSMGGRIASQIVAARPGPAVDRVSGLVFLGYPLHPPGRTDKMRKSHLDDISVPMLFVSGTRDNLARYDLLSNVVERLGPRATLASIEGGDHSFKRRKKDPPGSGVDEGCERVRKWLSRFL